MTSATPTSAPNRVGRCPGRRLLLAVVLAVVLVVVLAVVVVARLGRTDAPPLPLRPTAEMALPGNSSRFDYASLDPGRGLLFIAHLGASEVVEVDVHAHRVVRTIPDVAGVHGVLVVPALHRVYATATAADEMVTLDEDTGAALQRAPTGDYPDGLAYDPRRNAVWTTNESGGTETVIDAGSSAVRGTVPLGGEVGNVVYDPAGDHMLVPVQGRGDLAVIDPVTLAVVRRVPLPGCQHGHGLALDPDSRLGFVGCEGNAVLATVDLAGGLVTSTAPVGDTPDVLAYDPGAHRLYVAAEDGTVSVLDRRDRQAVLVGSAQLATGAHVVALDPMTHHSYFPIPEGSRGGPALLEDQPA